ncbi:MAG: flavin reductase family protein [Chloroflexi bacterium]|nr:flavin reductase family protein [Chloroflexota bacterium]
MLDQTAKKAVLRLSTYGLYAVTCAYEGDANVFTANWITQISFDPPMVALSVENDSASLPIILASGLFAVAPFATGQRDLAGALGKPRARAGDKLAGLPHTMSPSGLPILDATLGYVECRVTGQLVTGDSTLIAGEVIGAVLQQDGEPLTMREAAFKHSG